MSVASCCLSGFEWDGQPTGRFEKLNQLDVYVAGDSNPDKAIMIVHDLLGWSFPNVRLLADHYARETGATVYLPDFFAGEVLPFEPLLNLRFHEVDIAGFMGRNNRQVREPDIFAAAKTLRTKHKKLGAIGFCYGGWACFRLGAKEHQPPLVDFISTGHPSLVAKKDIDEVAVPVQILAPEVDQVFTAELKTHAFETIMKLGVPFDYQHFPGVEHACFVRGDEKRPGEQEAMVRAKNAAVAWFNQFLSTDA
ncbi:dienelactone hydrolase [Aulographum hederae CBS 113979]|uniref:Dienelactone hydrolase n=1 Tax=Aulographum hederae CBS 113979 TaxID=1176131 RepID=A0A6G1HCQ1_9PEZI|nr:dienelactone hydrolase [Aulographum hederae CBS 113979]